jgi:hypothetical protein
MSFRAALLAIGLGCAGQQAARGPDRVPAPAALDCTAPIGAFDRTMDAELETQTAGMAAADRAATEDLVARTAPSMKAAIERRCTGDRWSAAILDCYSRVSDRPGMDRCRDMLTADQRTALTSELSLVVNARPRSGIPDCDAYIDTVERLVVCEAVPDDARVAARRGLDQAAPAWAGMPVERQNEAAAACRAEVDALRRSLDEMGCK